MKNFANTTAYSYIAYREKVSKQLQASLTEAVENEITHYTQLNETRMNRLDKTIGLTADSVSAINKLHKKYTFFVISEGWCGDAAQILPVINKIASETEFIDLKIIFRDENPEIINKYLTNGSQSIPILVIFDDAGNELAVWGPRPKPAVAIIVEDKQKNGKVTEDGKTALQLWYNNDKGATIQNEILALLK